MKATAALMASLSAAGVILMGACTGASQGVTVPPGYENLSPCAVRDLRVEDLAATGQPGCDLEGSSLVFPDGTTLEILSVGTTFSHQPDVTRQQVEYYMVNWGIPGVGAALVKDDRIAGVWASSPQALDLQREALRIDGFW